MAVTPYPSLVGQKQFWETWNSTWRDPKDLNDWSIKRGETILNIIRSLALDQPRILDLGCGTGWLTEWLARLGPTTGVDLAEAVIEAAKARSPHITFQAGNILEMPLPANHFDVVVSQEVIAHVMDQGAYIARAAEVLKPDGYLIITTPNKFVIDRGEWLSQPPEHLEKWLTMRRLKRLLRSRFRIIHATTILPMGRRGILRVINSYKVNAMLRLLCSQQHIDALKEWAGLGFTLVVLAQKKA